MSAPAKKPQLVAEAPGTIHLKRGELLFKEGDTSRAMYLLKHGQIRIFKKKGDADIELDTVRTGQIIGELAFLDGNPRSASGEALTDCILIEISGPVFEKTLGTIPDWLKILLKTIVMRLRAASTKIRQLESSSSAIDYSDKDGKRVSQAVFVSPVDAMKVGTALLLVSKLRSEQIDLTQLHRYANQVMGIPVAKIQPLIEIFASAGIAQIDGETTTIKDSLFLERLIAYLNEENLASASNRHDMTPKGFLIMGMIAKHIGVYPKNEHGVATVDIGKVRKMETETLGKDAFHIDELQELVRLRYMTLPNLKSADEMLTEISVEQFLRDYRFQRVVMGILALNEQKRKLTKVA